MPSGCVGNVIISARDGISMKSFSRSTASCSISGVQSTRNGDVLDILVQPRRNKKAAKKFFRKLLKGLQYVPRAIVTDKLRSYAAAQAEVMPSVEHQQQGRLNNRAENSLQPTRERERRMRGFKSPGHAQRFLSVFGVIASFFRPGRHLLAAKNYREIMRRRFTQWREIVGLQPAI